MAGVGRRRRRRFAFGEDATIDPDFDADDAINGAGFREAVVNGNAESLQRDFPFFIPFGAGDVGTAEATGGTDPNAEGTIFHGGLEGAFHGAAEGNPAL